MNDQKYISVLIADDEPIARQVIRQFLGDIGGFDIVAECGDGYDVIQQIETLKPDLVFLDIEMPEVSGIELVHQLTPPLPSIVFVTAYDQYAVKAFEENAIDYILKPFDQERFAKCIDRVRKSLSMQVSESELQLDRMIKVFEALMQNQEHPRFLKKISCKQRGKIRFVAVSDIVWIESEGSFCKLHLADGIQLTNLSIKRLEELLDPNTHPRIHKSHMVNVDMIESIEPYFHGEYMINLEGGKTLKLSRGYKDRLEVILNQYK